MTTVDLRKWSTRSDVSESPAASATHMLHSCLLCQSHAGTAFFWNEQGQNPMPKKHQNRALLTKPASSAPSNLASNRTVASSSNGQSPKPTVNDLIRESRRTKGDIKQNVDASNVSSLPPSVRDILNMPAPSVIPPRTQIRGPGRLRRIPGPPPPQSWLIDSRYAPESAGSSFAQLRWLRARLQ